MHLQDHKNGGQAGSIHQMEVDGKEGLQIQ